MTSNTVQRREGESLLTRFLLHLSYGHGLSSKVRVAVIATLGWLVWLGIFPHKVERMLSNLSNHLCARITIRVEGITFRIRDSESYFICLPSFEEWMRNYLKPRENDVFLDVGAHIGKYALQYSGAVGDSGLVIAIEADPVNFKLLKENIELNRLHNIAALNIAAWSGNGKLRLFFGRSSGLGSVKKDMNFGYIEVSARALDTVLEEINVKKRVAWIKIDAEGAEFEIVKGLKKTLEEHNPTLIVEVLTQNIGKIKEYMNGLDYRSKIIFEGYDYDLPHVYMLFEKIRDGLKRRIGDRV